VTTSLESAVIRIYTADGVIVGAGFLVSEFHVITCAHVIADALDLPHDTRNTPQAELNLDFPLVAPNQTLTGQVVHWEPTVDVAVMELTNERPVDAKPLRLFSTDDFWGHPFRAFGFPKDYDNGVWASGRMLGPEATGWVQIEDLKEPGYWVQPGFSGTPIWDEQLKGVVGMAVASERRPEIKAAFMIPANVLVATWPELVQQAMPPIPPHYGFVGRDWLKKRVQVFVDDSRCSFLLLTGGPGIGKSAFVAEQVWASQEPIVAHSIKPLESNEDILRSLTEQLCSKYSLKKGESEEDQRAHSAFDSMLRQVSCSAKRKHCEVIYLDGLDEEFDPTFPSTHKALPSILSRPLPEGIKMVVTSRPGEHLNLLRGFTTVVETQEIDPGSQDNLEDIRTYLHKQNQAGKLGLDDEFIERLVDASEGYFVVAVQYVRDPDQLQKWANNPDLIPQGLNDWLIGQWQRLLTGAEAQNPPIDPQNVKGVLGLLAAAWEPLSRDHLLAFLSSVARQERGGDILWRVNFNAEELLRAGDKVLRLSKPFFGPLDSAQGTAAPYRFFHTLFRECVWNSEDVGLSEEERRELHHILANGCLGWPQFPRPIRDYALHHRVAHLIALREWLQVAQAFVEADFMVARGERFGFVVIHTDALSIAQAEDLSGDWKTAFNAWEQFLRWRFEQLNRFPGAYVQEVLNEFDAPRPIDKVFESLKDSVESTSPLFLRKISGPPAISGLGHSLPVDSVAFSPDPVRQWVASGSRDGIVKVCDTATGRLVAECRGHKKKHKTTSVMFCVDGQRVVSGSEDGSVKVWDAGTGRLLFELWEGMGSVTRVALSPDGNRILGGGWRVTGSRESSVRLWDARTGEPLLPDCLRYQGKVNDITFSPDDQWIALGSEDGDVKVWDARTGEPASDCLGHMGGVRTIAFSRDGQWIASGSEDGTVKVWASQTGDLVADCVGHTGRVNNVAISPDGQWVLSGSADGTVKVWQLRNGQRVASWEKSHSVESVAFSADGQWIASGCSKGIWYVEIEKLLVEDNERDAGSLVQIGPVNDISFYSSESKKGWLLAGGEYGTVMVWDVQNRRQVARWGGDTTQVTCASFSPANRRWVAFGDNNGEVSVWNVQGMKNQHNLEPVAKWRMKKYKGFRRHSVKSTGFSPDGRWVASGSKMGTVNVNQAEDGQLITDAGLDWHQGSVESVVFSPDSQRVASGGMGGLIKVWEAQTRRLIATCDAHARFIYSLAFSSDGQFVASGDGDGMLKVWAVQTGALLVEYDTDGVACSIAFSPKDRRIAAGCNNGQVQVWDVEVGGLVADCSGHTAKVNCLAFSPDGRWLASGSDDKIVRVCDTSTGQCHNTLFFDRAPIAVCFLEDSPLLMVAHKGGQVFGYEVLAEL
jgi:WD40 repeat protein